jgi:hypothetical protein
MHASNSSSTSALTPMSASHPASTSSSSSLLSPMPPLPTATPPLSPMASPYSASGDRTLTAAQASSGGFRPIGTDRVIAARPIQDSDFRFPSNPTTAGHSSGYHESFAPTDTMRFLSHRTVNSDGTATLPPWSSNTVLPSYSGSRIREENVRHVAEASDGARTDTAQTILSVPGGSAGGHTGSGVRTTGQAAAHDMQRHATIRTLQEPGVTAGVAGVVAGATTILGIAPGQSASSAEGAGRLKDKPARSDYEYRRNKAKRKLDRHFTSLPPAEQATAIRLVRPGMSALGDSGRHLLPDRPYSPIRDPVGPSGAAISGGGYVPTLTAPTPSPSAFPVLPGSASPSALLSPVVQHPPPATPTLSASSSAFSPVSGPARATPASTSTSSTSTTASGPSPSARAIAMDITSAFRSDRRS